MLLVLLFVYFARVKFCPFSLPLGVRGWLRLVALSLDFSIKVLFKISNVLVTCIKILILICYFIVW